MIEIVKDLTKLALSGLKNEKYTFFPSISTSANFIPMLYLLVDSKLKLWINGLTFKPIDENYFLKG